MQKWEYKTIRRHRGVKVLKGQMTGWNVDVVSMLPELGEKGWELVNVSTRSSTFGVGYAGMTNDEMWIFKRPKP